MACQYVLLASGSGDACALRFGHNYVYRLDQRILGNFRRFLVIGAPKVNVFFGFFRGGYMGLME